MMHLYDILSLKFESVGVSMGNSLTFNSLCVSTTLREKDPIDDVELVFKEIVNG